MRSRVHEILSNVPPPPPICSPLLLPALFSIFSLSYLQQNILSLERFILSLAFIPRTSASTVREILQKVCS